MASSTPNRLTGLYFIPCRDEQLDDLSSNWSADHLAALPRGSVARHCLGQSFLPRILDQRHGLGCAADNGSAGFAAIQVDQVRAAFTQERPDTWPNLFCIDISLLTGNDELPMPIVGSLDMDLDFLVSNRGDELAAHSGAVYTPGDLPLPLSLDRRRNPC